MTYTSVEEANRQLVLDVYEHVLKPFDSSRVDEYFRPNYIQHSPMAESGPEGLKKFLDWARGDSPNAVQDVKRVFADGDYVVVHTHVVLNPGERGFAVADFFRCEQGKIAEHWEVIQSVPADAPNSNGMF